MVLLKACLMLIALYACEGNTYSSSYGSPGCGSSSYTTPPPTQGSSGTGGGFWTGVGTGGLMCYLFGSRNSRQGYYQQPNQAWGSGWGGSGWGGSIWGYSGWGGSGWGSTRGAMSYGGSSARSSGWGSGSTSTRTASGFGGTKRP